MELQQAQNMAEQLMREHGLNDAGWTFHFDNRARRFGACHSGYRTIALSRPLVALNNEAAVRDTVLHEIAHAKVGCHNGHNAVWQAQCVAIGARPVRCVDGTVIKVPDLRYRAQCPKCEQVFTKARRPLENRGHACSACCKRFNRGRYTPAYQLHFYDTKARPSCEPLQTSSAI